MTVVLEVRPAPEDAQEARPACINKRPPQDATKATFEKFVVPRMGVLDGLSLDVS